MKQWFPFTDYDFYAYIAAGMLLIAAVDYTVAGAVLTQRSEWTVVQVVFWTVIAYLAGQLVASPSSALLEHGVARTLLHAPTAVLLGLRERRPRERTLAALFAGREYAPLPMQVRERILLKAAEALGVEGSKLTDPEAVFSVAHPVARSVPDAAERMDQFRNLYGFSRNVSLVALVATVLLAIKLWLSPTPQTGWLLVGAALLAIGMFGRFLKFYAAYASEVLRTYNSIPLPIRGSVK